MKRYWDNHGFTMIELIIVLAIIGVVMFMATNLIVFSIKSYNNDNTSWEIQQDARYAVQAITKDIRSAQYIELTNGTPYESTAILKPVLLIDKKIWYYQKSGTDKLYRYKDGGENIVMQNLNSISFPPNSSIEDYSDKILILKIVTQKSGMDKTYELTTKLYSRMN